MSTVIPVGDATVRVVYSGTGLSKEVGWGFGMHYDSGMILPGGPSSAASDIHAALTDTTNGPFAAGMMSGDFVLERVEVAYETADGPITGVHAIPVAGTSNTHQVPINSAMLLTKNTALGGRKNRGRAYIPPCWTAEEDIDGGGHILASSLTVRNTRLGFCLVTLTTGSSWPVVHHSDGTAGTKITSWSVGTLLASQRRRMR